MPTTNTHSQSRKRIDDRNTSALVVRVTRALTGLQGRSVPAEKNHGAFASKFDRVTERGVGER